MSTTEQSVFNIDDDELRELATKMMNDLEIKDRSYHLKTYKACFLGSDAVQWMLNNGYVTQDIDGELLGQQLMEDKLIYHITKDAKFENRSYFYRFTAQDDHGKASTDAAGNKISWSSVSKFLPDMGNEGADAKITNYASSALASDGAYENVSGLLSEIDISPLDKYNTELLDNVHPAKWTNPTSTNKYTLIAIGAGSGGLVSAAGAAGVGAKVALIESHLTGGDCLNFGCVPSKALIRAARAVKDVKDAEKFGVTIDGKINVDFGKAMERLRRLRAEISEHDSYTRFSRDIGIDIYQGRAELIGKNKIKVNDRELEFKKCVIATGASPAIPKISGLSDAPYLTNYTIFNLEELPPRVCVIGAGPIGIELAQALARFGSKVTCLVRGNQLLPKEDRDAADIVHKALLDDDITIHFNTKYLAVNTDSQGGKYKAPFNVMSVLVDVKGEQITVPCDALLVATGRRPNVEGMGLDVAGVKYDTRSGVSINEFMQTTNKNVFAVGDVCTRFQFTHVADFMARAVIRNALFFGSGKQSALLIPWATYTEPEVAHVGLYEADMKERNIAFDTYTKHFDDVDRAICDGDIEGFVKVHCKKGTDEILGATIVNPSAGNMISEITMAMQYGIGLGKVATVIHPYPTQAEAVRMCGDLYNRTRLTPTVKGLLNRIANRSLT